MERDKEIVWFVRWWISTETFKIVRLNSFHINAIHSMIGWFGLFSFNRHRTGEYGHSYAVTLPDSSPLKQISGTELILLTISPNMNINRADCLINDPEKVL